MHSHRFLLLHRAVAVATLAALLTSCVSTNLPPISSSGAAFTPLDDERELWAQARDEEQKLLEKARLYDDPLLESYLNGVAARLTSPGFKANRAIQIRVHVIEDPTLNAFAYPHGALYVHTGLLARMENEDQLATVLGHEMTHVEGRHMLRYQRTLHNRQVGLTIAAFGAAVIAAEIESDALRHHKWGTAAAVDALSNVIIVLGLQLAFLAAVNGYGRELEGEADEGGFTKMSAAGYRLGEAPKVYEALLEERGDSKKIEAFFFGNHPRLAERIENSKEYVAQHPGAGSGDPAGGTGANADSEFARRMRPVVRDDARLNIDIGRLGLAESELRRAHAEMPDDPETRFQEGRLRLAQALAESDPQAQRRLRGQAANAFNDAIRLDAARPGPHRELGLLFYDQENWSGACRELRRYVELAPDATDTGRIRDYVLELQRDKYCP